MNRRTFILAGLSTSLFLSSGRSQTMAAEADFPPFDRLGREDKEDHISEDLPDAEPQGLTTSQESILKSATGKVLADFPKLKKIDLGAEMVREAMDTDRYNGRSRSRNGREVITEMLELAGNNPYQYGKGEYVPFCAAGLVHLACMTYSRLSEHKRLTAVIQPGSTAAQRYSMFDILLPTIREHYFFPSAGVRFVVAYARDKKQNWLSMEDVRRSKSSISKGWLVVFRFPRGFHIGIVTKDAAAGATAIDTFEFNTANPDAAKGADERNGGWIGPRKRDLTSAIGFISLQGQI